MLQATCIITGQNFIISDQEEEYCKSRGLPLPRITPNERLKHILSFRNRTFLYNTTCAFSKKPILSCIAPDKGFTIYDNDVWNSEAWDPLDYGIDYDPSLPFFEQLGQLYKKVPLPNLTIVRTSNENSEYVNGAANLRNCYLIFASVGNEDCMFCWNVFGCKNVVDTISAQDCELCYSCTNIDHCYQVQHVDSSNHCSESYFLESCQACKNCFGCVNLSNKQYCWYNEQLTQPEYENRLKALDLGNYEIRQAELKKFEAFKKMQPRKYLLGKNNESSTGNYINNCKGASNIFHCTEAIDTHHSIGTNKTKDSFCSAYSTGGELVYNIHAGLNHYNIQYCAECVNGKNLTFCLYCVLNCSDCFGCVGLKKKQYCILNKQYSKEEYEKLVSQIKADMTARNEWQEYFPKHLSQVYYNQCDAMLVFPLTKAEALKQGFSWKDEQIEAAGETAPIPQNIKDVTDTSLQNTYLCEATGKKFRLIKAELGFYRQMNIPLPHIAPLERLHTGADIFQITPLNHIHCSKCQKDLESVYAPNDRKILCEECFLNTVY